MTGTPSALPMMRTIVLAYSTFVGLDEDALSDLRLAVDEAATALIVASEPKATEMTVVLTLHGDDVAAEISTDAIGEEDPLGDANRRLLDALADDVQSFRFHGDTGARGDVVGISFTSNSTTPSD